jgi:hypothetical protein
MARYALVVCVYAIHAIPVVEHVLAAFLDDLRVVTRDEHIRWHDHVVARIAADR